MIIGILQTGHAPDERAARRRRLLRPLREAARRARPRPSGPGASSTASFRPASTPPTAGSSPARATAPTTTCPWIPPLEALHPRHPRRGRPARRHLLRPPDHRPGAWRPGREIPGRLVGRPAPNTTVGGRTARAERLAPGPGGRSCRAERHRARLEPHLRAMRRSPMATASSPCSRTPSSRGTIIDDLARAPAARASCPTELLERAQRARSTSRPTRPRSPTGSPTHLQGGPPMC